jgi:hypothetical protein
MAFVYFDLDGVMRNTFKYVMGKTPQVWDCHMDDGQHVMDYINANLHVLEDAPPTALLPIILTVPRLCILTVQPEAWKPYTRRWLAKHVGREGLYHVMWFDSPEAKLEFVMTRNEKVWLVEDYPFFTDYSRIALVDWPYNRRAMAINRFRSPMDLHKFLLREKVL